MYLQNMPLSSVHTTAYLQPLHHDPWQGLHNLFKTFGCNMQVRPAGTYDESDTAIARYKTVHNLSPDHLYAEGLRYDKQTKRVQWWTWNTHVDFAACTSDRYEYWGLLWPMPVMRRIVALRENHAGGTNVDVLRLALERKSIDTTSIDAIVDDLDKLYKEAVDAVTTA